jgi:hypothetical protein
VTAVDVRWTGWVTLEDGGVAMATAGTTGVGACAGGVAGRWMFGAASTRACRGAGVLRRERAAGDGAAGEAVCDAGLDVTDPLAGRLGAEGLLAEAATNPGAAWATDWTVEDAWPTSPRGSAVADGVIQIAHRAHKATDARPARTQTPD